MYCFLSRRGTMPTLSVFVVFAPTATRSSTVRDHVYGVTDTLTSNHGGVAAVAFTNARLERLELGATPSTFELLCVRVSTGSSSCVVAVIYRPGSAAVSTTFYTELTDLLERLVTFVDPIYVVGDLNTCAFRSTWRIICGSTRRWPTTGCRAVSTRQHTTKAACWMSSLPVGAVGGRGRRWSVRPPSAALASTDESTAASLQHYGRSSVAPS